MTSRLARLAALENATMARMFQAVDHELSIMPEVERQRIGVEYQRSNDPMVITRVMCEMLAKHGLLQALDVLKDRRVEPCATT